jgi:DNA-binding CsgD family transcriptional regulator
MKYQVMPELSGEEFSELKADIAKRGVMIPIEFDEDGNVLDGHHRLRACQELGIAEYPKVVRKGMSEEEKRSHARSVNINRRHLTRKQVQELVKEQLAETPELSDRQIAKGLKVDHKTVNAHRVKMEQSGEIPHMDKSIGADGKTRSRNPKNSKKEPVSKITDKLYSFLYAHYKSVQGIKEIPAESKAVFVMRCEADEVSCAIELLRSWGFKNKSCGVIGRSGKATDEWLKDRYEFFLIAIKGNHPMPKKTVKSYYGTVSNEFGRKMAEFLFPDSSYCEVS